MTGISRISVLLHDERARHGAAFCACLGVCAIALWPTLGTGWMADDAVNSLLTSTALAARHSGVWQQMGEFVSTWARSGRFFPFAAYDYLLFWAVNGNLVLYKALCFAALLGDIALFGVLVTQLAGSRSLGMAAMATSVAVLQNTDFHDPIVAFAGLLQVDFALITGALVLFLLFIRKGGAWRLWVSVALYSVALLTYEIIAPLAILFIIAAWIYGKRRTIKEALVLSWPYLVAVGVAVSITLVLRIAFGSSLVARNSSDAYSLSLAPLPFVTTLAKQLFASLPLAYAAGRGAGVSQALGAPFASLGYDLRVYPLTSLLILAGVSGVAGWALWDAMQHIGPRARPIHLDILAAFGAAYLILPALLISLSPRWQQQLYWGVGYLPVYIQFFGVALLLVSGIYWLIRIVGNPTMRRVVVVIAALAIGLVGVDNFQDNRILLQSDNVSWNYQRTVAEAALEHGIASDVKPKDVVLFTYPVAYGNQDFIVDHAGVRPSQTKTLAEFTPTDAQSAGMTATKTPDGQTGFMAPSTGRAIWNIANEGRERDTGVTVFGRIEALTFKGTTVTHAFLRPTRAFSFIPPEEPPSPDTLWGSPLAAGVPPTLQSLGVQDANARVLAGTPAWTLVALPGTQIVRIDASTP